MEAISDKRPAGVGPDSMPIPGHPGYWCGDLDKRLAEALIARTLDAEDVRLREMTRDLARFSSADQLERWRPGRDLLCLQDDDGALMGVGWVADKPLPERDDYFDPKAVRRHAPRLTCAIRTYGPARGRGLLTKAFATLSLETLLRRRGTPHAAVWFETKAVNSMARALARQTGFVEVSGEAGGTVVGIRPAG